MQALDNYSELTSHIHAPDHLKARVLAAARASKNQPTPQTQVPALVPKKRRPGRYSRGFSFASKAAIIALMAISLPLTAYAAARHFGLRDYLAQRGMKDMQAIESLTSTFVTEPPQEAAAPDAQTEPEAPPPDAVNEYAAYTMLEAVCDQNMLYLSARITPVNDDYFLMPGDFFSSDDVSCLNIPGVSGCTIEEYAESLGKTLLSVSVGYYFGEAHFDGTYWSEYQPDGTILMYNSGQNLAEGPEITLSCRGNAVSEKDWSINEHTEFTITFTNQSTSQKEAAGTQFDPKILEDLNLTMVSLDIEQTTLGTYFTFTWTDGSPEGYNFKVIDAAGNEPPYMPDQISTGGLDNGDGTFSEKVFYQKLPSTEGFQFMIKSWEHGGEWFGPYPFPS